MNEKDVNIIQTRTNLEWKSTYLRMWLDYHQSNVQRIDPSQQMLNETKQMVVCYESFSVPYETVIVRRYKLHPTRYLLIDYFCFEITVHTMYIIM
jgi:hypothetical protein